MLENSVSPWLKIIYLVVATVGLIISLIAPHPWFILAMLWISCAFLFILIIKEFFFTQSAEELLDAYAELVAEYQKMDKADKNLIAAQEKVLMAKDALIDNLTETVRIQKEVINEYNY